MMSLTVIGSGTAQTMRRLSSGPACPGRPRAGRASTSMPMLRQMRRRPDARQQQKLRRVDRAAAQHHLAPRAHACAARRAGGTARPTARLPSNSTCCGQRVGLHPQIGPVARRVQVAHRGRAAPPVARGELVVADALLHRAVEIVVAWETEIYRALDERLADRVVVAHVGDRRAARRRRARRSAPRTWSSARRKYGSTSSNDQPALPNWRQQVEILRLAADIDQAVDRGRPAQHLAARPEDPAGCSRRDRARSRSTSSPACR